MNNQIKKIIETDKNLEIALNNTLGFVINKLNVSKIKTVFVIEDKKVIGSITDGDIRRSIIKNISINTPINKIMNKKPILLGLSKNGFLKKTELIVKKKQNYIFPVIDNNKKYLGFIRYQNFKKKLILSPKKYDVVIMAGGFGKRLGPLTKKLPKPLIRVNGVPILNRVISKVDNLNVNKIYITLHYRSDKIIHFLKKINSKKIITVIEKKPLDTFGSLNEIKNKLTKDILVINSDIITTLDTNDLFDFHMKKKSDLTLCTKKYESSVDFGVLKIKGNKVLKITEKPSFDYWINTGIYFLKKNCLFKINKKKINAVDFINTLIIKNFKIFFYPMYEIWFDIGTQEQLKLADAYLKKIDN
ncbi:K24305 lea6; UDP-2-acetamido-4-(D-alanylamino)-2,4,6-trideoxy-alpha-D-mannopyranose hydrolase [Candidatus Pelagibacterales bacterium]